MIFYGSFSKPGTIRKISLIIKQYTTTSQIKVSWADHTGKGTNIEFGNKVNKAINL